LDELTSVQLSEWEAYDTLDPVGKWRDDYHAAFIISEVTNIVKDLHGEKGAKRSTPSEFMPKWNNEDAKKEIKKRGKDPSKSQSVDEMKQFMTAFASAQNKFVHKTRTTPPHKKARK